MVHPPNSLSEHGRDIQHLELGADPLVLVLGNRVGDYDLVDAAGVDPGNGISAEDTVRDEHDDLEGTLTLQKLSGASDGVRGVDDVVDKDADTVGNVTNQHHAGVSLLVVLDGAAFL